MDETHARDNIWLPSPPAPQKKTTRNFNSLRQGCGTREQAENDQRNGFPVQGRSKTRGCESLALDPPLTNVHFRWPRLFPLLFLSFPWFLLSFFYRPKGRKPVLERSTPSRTQSSSGAPGLSDYRAIQQRPPVWNLVKRNRWWRTMGRRRQGGWRKGRERLITFY